jgi:hypothetical protein
MKCYILAVCLLLLEYVSLITSFNLVRQVGVARHRRSVNPVPFVLSVLEGEGNTDGSMFDGVVELADDAAIATVDKTTTATETKINGGTSFGAFLSQGEIDPEALNPDLSDPKQARVIIYMILSLAPVLFLIPLMIGSRDLVPLDAIPPVQLY